MIVGDFSQSITVIVPVAQQATANVFAEQLTGIPADANTFQPNCSASGSLPATACISGPAPIRPEYAQQVITRMVPAVAGSLCYLTDALTGNLVETNSPTAQPSIGNLWGAVQSLADAGLQLITGGVGVP